MLAAPVAGERRRGRQETRCLLKLGLANGGRQTEKMDQENVNLLNSQMMGNVGEEADL